MKIRFNNDYNQIAHPVVMEALQSAAQESYGGYGMDDCCAAAEEAIKKHLNKPEAKVHFLIGGTQANYTMITAALRPYESVICADTGHIHVHETGAVENTGHKIEAIVGKDGKLTAAQIKKKAQEFADSDVQEHITEPKMVYLSFPTELGTIYSKQELEEISQVCREYGMYLFVDGARMAYGLGSAQNDLTLEDFARLTDAFYCGGTKCGAMFGEALVITNPALQSHFRSYMKQNGAMLAKGWLLGLQFKALFASGAYFELGKTADAYAMKIRKAFLGQGIPFHVDSPTNQQFVVLSNAQVNQLAEKYIFENEGRIDENHTCVRFCTSWSTKAEDVEALLGDIEKLFPDLGSFE